MAIALEHNGRQIRISFKREEVPVGRGKNTPEERAKRGQQPLLKTKYTCEVWEPPNGRAEARILGRGSAVCSFQDRFNTREGRKLALQRALVDAGEAYYTRDGKFLLYGRGNAGAAILAAYFQSGKGAKQMRKEKLAKLVGRYNEYRRLVDALEVADAGDELLVDLFKFLGVKVS